MRCTEDLNAYLATNWRSFSTQNYFDKNGIELRKLIYSGNEVDKDIDNVEQILVDLKKREVARHVEA